MNSRHKHSGVTMVELLTVMTIAAILMAVAVPSYRYVTTANRIAGEINGLLGDLQFARYEAIKEGLPVTICSTTASTDTACAASATWTGGWIVQSSTGAVLRRQVPFGSFNSSDALTAATGGTGVTSVVFNREGFVSSGAAMFSLHDPTSNAGFTRCLMVNVAGALGTTTSGKILYTVTCS
jgi:type IV fimbrial biogenesis protein FimT